jgi:crotonobetainyl-CoA:carnitine CoA-transferase CaiB-like acyl-CoA transferase
VGVPCGPVNALDQVFGDPQVQHRGGIVSQPHPRAHTGEVKTMGNPLKLSETPVQYRLAPPMRGQHQAEVLSDWLGD